MAGPDAVLAEFDARVEVSVGHVTDFVQKVGHPEKGFCGAGVAELGS